MAAAAILDEIAKFYRLTRSRGLRRISVPNIVKICQSTVSKYIKILQFFKMAAVAILDFQLCKILFADSVQRAQGYKCTKFHQNGSFRCGDITVFQFFNMAAAAMLYF